MPSAIVLLHCRKKAFPEPTGDNGEELMKLHFIKIVFVFYILFGILALIGGMYIKEKSYSVIKPLPVWNEIIHDKTLSKEQQDILWEKAEKMSFETKDDFSAARIYGPVCGILFVAMSYFFLYFYFYAIRPLSEWNGLPGRLPEGIWIFLWRRNVPKCSEYLPGRLTA